MPARAISVRSWRIGSELSGRCGQRAQPPSTMREQHCCSTGRLPLLPSMPIKSHDASTHDSTFDERDAVHAANCGRMRPRMGFCQTTRDHSTVVVESLRIPGHADHDSGLMPITLGRPRNADRHSRNARLSQLLRSGAGQTGGACRLHWEVEVSGCRRRGCPCARSEKSYGLSRSA